MNRGAFAWTMCFTLLQHRPHLPVGGPREKFFDKITGNPQIWETMNQDLQPKEDRVDEQKNENHGKREDAVLGGDQHPPAAEVEQVAGGRKSRQT